MSEKTPTEVAEIKAALGMFYHVEQQHYGIVERSGSFRTIVGPGSHVKRPVSDKVFDVSLRETTHTIDFEGVTSDGARATLSVECAYRVDDSDSVDVYSSGVYRFVYSVENRKSRLSMSIAKTLSSMVCGYTVDELVADQEALAQAVCDKVNREMFEYGFVIESIAICAIHFDSEVERAHNAYVAAQMDAQAEIAKAEAEARVAELAAASEIDVARIASDGDLDDAKTRAKVAAEIRVEQAESLSVAIDTLKASGLMTEAAAELLVRIGNVDALREFAAAGASSVVLPSEMVSSSGAADALLKSGAGRSPSAGIALSGK